MTVRAVTAVSRRQGFIGDRNPRRREPIFSIINTAAPYPRAMSVLCGALRCFAVETRTGQVKNRPNITFSAFGLLAWLRWWGYMVGEVGGGGGGWGGMEVLMKMGDVDVDVDRGWRM